MSILVEKDGSYSTYFLFVPQSPSDPAVRAALSHRSGRFQSLTSLLMVVFHCRELTPRSRKLGGRGRFRAPRGSLTRPGIDRARLTACNVRQKRTGGRLIHDTDTRYIAGESPERVSLGGGIAESELCV